jgi:siderophore synthetase component
MLDLQDGSHAIAQESLSEEEEKVLAYLQTEHPDLVDLYLSGLVRGRLGILQRLLVALVRERFITNAQVSRREGGQTMLHVPLSGVKELRAPIGREYTLGRFDLAGHPVLISGTQAESLSHPTELLDLLKQEGVFADIPEPNFARFRQELENGTSNYALALAGAKIRRRELVRLAEEAGIHTSLEWVSSRTEADYEFSPLAFYEQWVVEGHPLHPGAKTRFGLETGDVLRYSPEWGATPQAALVAVARDVCRTYLLDGHGAAAILCEEYPRLVSAAEQCLVRLGLDATDYELIPVHPWQFDQTLPALYRDAIGKRQIVPLPEVRIPTRALVSFRSLAPIAGRQANKHHIKTAINVQTTSAVRTVSPQSAENGPILSRMLRAIQERECGFNGRLVCLEERAGVHYQPSDPSLSADECWKLQANLAAILRENPERHVKPGEIPMVAAALLAQSPISGKLIVRELIDALTANHGINDLQQAAVTFIRRYAETALPGLLTLSVRYGIALEAHMQNSVSVFRNGELVRLIVRDYGGVRIFRERLSRHGFTASFAPGSSIVTDNVDQMRSIISYSVMQNHVAELIASIVRATGVEEAALWQPVIAVCREVFRRLKQDPDISGQAMEDEEALFAPEIGLKALTTMRLRGDATDYAYRNVPNPLFQWKGEVE